MPDRNRVQAMFPVGSEVVFNEMGTAPGVWMKIGRAWFGAMPGVPSEMFVMFDKQIVTRLKKLGLGSGIFRQRKINTFGEGESAIEEKLLDITKRGHIPEVGITASDASIALRILAKGVTEEEVQQQIAPVEAIIRERLGDLVFGVEDEELQDVVVRLLKEKKKSLATVESVTGGAVAAAICRVPGASECYVGGVVAYQNATKIGEFGIAEDLLDQFSAVSSEVAMDLAVRCRRKFKTDLAICTVGYAGPGGGTPDKPLGTVYVALSHADGVDQKSHQWMGTRDDVIRRTAKIALNMVRLRLMKS